ncbi:hypothetical protein L6258_03865, partial [Candidatus Parcubacteria bacterium]|nr:hypothetical protein [Candidatus Parcubacteria bacterium]
DMTIWEIVLLLLSVLFIVGFLGISLHAFWLFGIEKMKETGATKENIEDAQPETAARLAEAPGNFP